VGDEKQAYVRLKLRDLTIIDQFICYSEYGIAAEPTHRALKRFDAASETSAVDLESVHIGYSTDEAMANGGWRPGAGRPRGAQSQHEVAKRPRTDY
jgi:hypothetical protein